MSNQNSSGDDSNRDDGRRTDNGDVGNSEHPEEHDDFEGMGRILDQLMRENPALHASVLQSGNVDSLTVAGEDHQGDNVDSRLEEDDEHQDVNADGLPAEDHAVAAGGLEPGPCWQLEALANRVQAVIVAFLQRMNNVEVSEMLEKGMEGGIVPDPNTPLETKVHTERKKKNRRTNQEIREDEAHEARNTAIYFDPRWYCVSQFVFFYYRIS
jgi:hypothetical protein